jgi:hypothetical protein
MHELVENVPGEVVIAVDWSRTTLRLARNIFHELMHVFQYDKWTNTAWGFEDFPTELDPQLPRDHFETKEYDEAGAKPLDDPLPPPPKKQ